MSGELLEFGNAMFPKTTFVVRFWCSLLSWVLVEMWIEPCRTPTHSLVVVGYSADDGRSSRTGPSRKQRAGLLDGTNERTAGWALPEGMEVPLHRSLPVRCSRGHTGSTNELNRRWPNRIRPRNPNVHHNQCSVESKRRYISGSFTCERRSSLRSKPSPGGVKVRPYCYTMTKRNWIPCVLLGKGLNVLWTGPAALSLSLSAAAIASA